MEPTTKDSEPKVCPHCKGVGQELVEYGNEESGTVELWQTCQACKGEKVILGVKEDLPQTFEQLLSGVSSPESRVKVLQHVERICWNYIQKALALAYNDDAHMKTALKKEDIK